MRAVPCGAACAGLGDCTSSISSYNGVPYCRDNITGSLVPCTDPGCATPAAGGGNSNVSPVYVAPPPSMSTQQFGSSTTTTFTLDSYLAAQAQAMTTPAGFKAFVNEGGTPSNIGQTLMQIAQGYCLAEGVSDCGNISAIVAKYTAIVQAALAGLPASQWNVATYSAYATGSGSPPPAATVQNGGANNIAASVVMRNTSRAGFDSSYQVGDNWQLTITGAPGAAVTAAASQNGASLGTTPFGSLNSSGQMVLTGTMSAGQVGNWQETWNVAGSPAVGISLTVAAAGAAGSNAGSSNAGAGGSNTTAAGSGFTFPDLSSIPSWAWLAGGGVVLLMVLKK